MSRDNTAMKLNDDLPLVPKETLDNVCKPGTGKTCCRFLVAGAAGIECAKHSELAGILNGRANAGTMVAQGDNCEGLKPFGKKS